MRPESRRLARITAAIAVISSLVIAIGIPAAYFASGIAQDRGEIGADVHERAVEISQIISRNPEFWLFDAHGIDGILTAISPHKSDDFRRVILADGTIAYSHHPGETLPFFRISESEDLYESGVVVGAIEIVHSIAHVLLATGIVAIGAAFLAVATYFFVRHFPLRAMEKAWEEASHDSLTGLPNRVLLGDRIEQALSHMHEKGDSLAVFCIDLDHFKEVNDTLGHAAGDLMLKLVAERLRANVRDIDTVARLGGDEFVILQVGVGQPSDVAATARKLIDAVSQPYDLNGQQALIGMSIGIALPEDHTISLSQILQNGDAALYRAKANGRRDFCFFDEEMNNELRKRQEAERELITALREDQFEVFYQPQINLKTGRITGVEALIRWNHPTRGILEPEFVRLAEETGLIIPIGEWVLRRACMDCARWPDVRLAVNISPVQLVKSDLVAMVKRVLDETGFDPRRLELEVTEEILIERTELLLKTFEELKAIGIKIAMDDFGTGYSSLSYLRKFRFDKLKIDRSFLQEFENNPESRALMHTIISMGQNMNISVNAEGVETNAQAEWLASELCTEAQGFHFARPLQMQEMDVFISSFSASTVEIGSSEPDDREAAPDRAGRVA